jgi:hypothetical protein
MNTVRSGWDTYRFLSRCRSVRVSPSSDVENETSVKDGVAIHFLEFFAPVFLGSLGLLKGNLEYSSYRTLDIFVE